MFTNRSFYLLIVTALLVVTACAPQVAATSLPTSVPAATLTPIPPTPTAAPAVEEAPTSVKPIPHMPLPPGTYKSEVFETPLTYTVPEGWKMFEDEPGQFGLALLENDGPCLCVWRDVRAAALSCEEEPEPGVGSSAADIVQWLASQEGLDTSAPQSVTIGGLNGYVIDVRISPDWTHACPFSNGKPTFPTLVGTSPLSETVFWGAEDGSSQRYYFLDLGENGTNGNIAITVEVCCGAQWDERMAAVTPVVESFVFDTK